MSNINCYDISHMSCHCYYGVIYSMKRYIIVGNETDWCDLSLADRSEYDNISFFNTKNLIGKNSILYPLMNLHFSDKLNRRINAPFKGIWNKTIVDYLGIDEKDDIYLIIYDWHRLGRNESFLNYIMKNFKNVRLVYVFTNIVEYSGAKTHNFVHKLDEYYNAIMAFDLEDAKKYSFSYSPLVYSKKLNKNIKETSDVFYLGKAKDRYNMLIEVFEKLKKFDLKCDFTIADVNDTEKFYEEEIKYIDYHNYIPYKEAVKRLSSSKYLLDIIQGDSTGLTIKTCEAIYHNKKLITTNKHIKDYLFYENNKENILIIESAEDLTESFFKDNNDVCYTDDALSYFSLDSFLFRIEKACSKK